MGWTCMWVPKMTNTCVFLVPRLLNSDPHVTIGLMMWPGLVTSGAESWQFACDPLCIGCAQVWSKSPITLTPKWPKQSWSESSKIQQLWHYRFPTKSSRKTQRIPPSMGFHGFMDELPVTAEVSTLWLVLAKKMAVGLRYSLYFFWWRTSSILQTWSVAWHGSTSGLRCGWCAWWRWWTNGQNWSNTFFLSLSVCRWRWLNDLNFERPTYTTYNI